MSNLPDVVEAKRTEIEELCRKYAVERLYIFGSAARDAMTEDSDIDFVVDLGGGEGYSAGYADRYFGLAEDLEEVFNRHVDLITVRSIKNPYFRSEVERTRKLLYAA
jgi:predicted nucleotidyltransferase